MQETTRATPQRRPGCDTEQMRAAALQATQGAMRRSTDAACKLLASAPHVYNSTKHSKHRSGVPGAPTTFVERAYSYLRAAK